MSGSKYTTPALAAAGLIGVALYVTRGRATAGHDSDVSKIKPTASKEWDKGDKLAKANPDLSTTIQGLAGTGGASTRDQGTLGHDPKNTLIMSNKSDTPTKKS